MMKNILLLINLFVLTAVVNVNAQGVCGAAHPTQAEYDYTKNVIANIMLTANAGLTCIPIRPHIVRMSDGSGGISLADINLGISHLNEYYYNAGLEFYLCGTTPDYIDSDTYYDFQSADEVAMANAGNEVTNAINMYFVNGIDYTGGSSYVAGYAYLPANTILSTRVVMRNGSTADGSTLVHEMGHHFNLFHTFNGTILGNGNTNAENVPRPPSAQANCTAKGDLLCDTDADPGYTGTNINASCVYTGGGSDVNGVPYTPPTSNIMSYFPAFCQNPGVLTPDQYVRIQQANVIRSNHSAYSMDCPGTNVTDPTSLVGVFSGTGVDLTWLDNANNEMGYFIERSAVSATSGFRAFGGFATGVNGTSFTDNSGSIGTYYYRVKAVNDGCNDYSNVVTVIVPCVPSSNNFSDEHISSVSLNTISNTSGGSSYTNYSATIFTDLTVGTSYPYTVVSAGGTGNGYAEDTCAIWIDWNQDGDFDDTDEFIVNTGGVGPYTGNITPPASATAGNTTMRIRVHYDDEVSSPCGSATWGEVEDYGINVVTASCNISAITAGTQTACVSATNTYTQQVTVTYTTAPTSGTLDINGQSFAITTSPQTETLTNLTADGNAVNVIAVFSADASCTMTSNGLFTAPSDCSPTCNISAIAAGTQTTCVSATNTYTQQVTVTYTTAPTSGTLDINGQSFAITGSPQTETLTNLTADGNAVNVTAVFSADAACTMTSTGLFTAPSDCSPTCNISAMSAGTQTACVSATNTYTQQVTVTYTTAPTSGTLDINGQSFAITTSPQTETLTNLTADGNGVNVTAVFSTDAACTMTSNSLFTAPADCSPTCNISAMSAGTQTACVSATNTYTQQVTVTYTTAPTSGTLDINGQSFAITTSPQTETLTNLTADGNAVNVTAVFSADASCTMTSLGLFTAPVSCAAATSATIVYMVDPPGAGSLDVNSINATVFPFSANYAVSTNITLDANSNANYVFQYWETNTTTINPNINTSTANFNVVGNDTIIAHFDDYLTDTLWVITNPAGVATLEVGSDIITSSPFMGIYEVGEILNINVVPNGSNVFNQWSLSGVGLPDYNANTYFIFNGQDTLFAYFNKVLAIEDLGEDISSVKLYPTVVNHNFTIEIDASENSRLNIEIYNLAGQKVQHVFEGNLINNQMFKEDFKIDLNDGVYLVKINTDKTSIVQKIVVVK